LFQTVSFDGLISRFFEFSNGFVIVEVRFEARQSVWASSKFFVFIYAKDNRYFGLPKFLALPFLRTLFLVFKYKCLLVPIFYGVKSKFIGVFQLHVSQVYRLCVARKGSVLKVTALAIQFGVVWRMKWNSIACLLEMKLKSREEMNAASGAFVLHPLHFSSFSFLVRLMHQP
jgi:hypothetical protein